MMAQRFASLLVSWASVTTRASVVDDGRRTTLVPESCSVWPAPARQAVATELASTSQAPGPEMWPIADGRRADSIDDDQCTHPNRRMSTALADPSPPL